MTIILLSIIAIVHICMLIAFIMLLRKVNQNRKYIHAVRWDIIQILVGVRWFAYKQHNGKVYLNSTLAIGDEVDFIGGNKPSLFDEVKDD